MNARIPHPTPASAGIHLDAYRPTRVASGLIPPVTCAAPPCPKGLHVYLWHTDATQPVVCHVDHSPAEAGAREAGTGLQLDPDYPGSVTLVAAYVRDVDIVDLLSDDQVKRIQEQALTEIEDGQDEPRNWS